MNASARSEMSFRSASGFPGSAEFPETEFLPAYKSAEGKRMRSLRSVESDPGPPEPASGDGPRLPGPVMTGVLAGLIVVLTAVGASLFSMVKPVVYGARAEVLFEPARNVRADDAEALAATRKVLASSRAVLEPVARAQGISVAQLEDVLAIEPVAGSNVTRFTVGLPDPAAAQVLAQAAAEQYAAALKPATADAQPAVEFIGAEIERLRAERAAVEAQLAAVGGSRALAGQTLPIEAQGLADQSRDLQRRIGELQDRLTELELDGAQVRILTPAFVLDQPLAPKPARAAAAGTLAGLVIASALVVFITQKRARA